MTGNAHADPHAWPFRTVVDSDAGRWEYSLVPIGSGIYNANQHGKDGWRVVPGVVRGDYLLMERELVEPPGSVTECSGQSR